MEFNNKGLNCFQDLKEPTHERMLVLAAAMHEGYSIDELYNLTKIDRWFLNRLKNISNITSELLQLKVYMYRDRIQITNCVSK